MDNDAPDAAQSDGGRRLFSRRDILTLTLGLLVLGYTFGFFQQDESLASHPVVSSIWAPIAARLGTHEAAPITADQCEPVAASRNEASPQVRGVPVYVGVERDRVVNRTQERQKAQTDEGGAASNSRAAAIEKMAADIEDALADLVEEDAIEVSRKDDRMEVEIRSSVLFASGSGRLSPAALPLLRALAGKLSAIDRPIRVEGFTDNLPIQTDLYPSNWELAAMRAAGVTRFLEEEGLARERLVSVGFGERRPIASNATAEGRAKNRRVVVVVNFPKEVAAANDAAG